MIQNPSSEYCEDGLRTVPDMVQCWCPPGMSVGN